jgi:predicted nucleic acid-binding protein
VVLDTSVIIKSLLKPPKHLPRHIYERELETHRKCKAIMKQLKEKDYLVYFPRAGLVETAAVLRRNGIEPGIVKDILEAIEKTFIVVREEQIFDKAIEVAMTEAPSGFDTYFIALALKTRALLVTDDEAMAIHARHLNIDTLLVRSTEDEEIKEKLDSLT